MNDNKEAKKKYFTAFQESTDSYSLPDRFTFPFYYEPHPLCILAAKELQNHLESQTEWDHNFGLKPEKKGLVIGKMFGVLVVQNEQGELGYLAAFSGKLADKNHHFGFVPPVFDNLAENSFFNAEAEEVNQINDQIEMLQNDPKFLEVKAFLEEETALSLSQLKAQKQAMKTARQDRKVRRQIAIKELRPDLLDSLNEALDLESQNGSIFLKNLTLYWKSRLAESQQKVDLYLQEIAFLQAKRREKSGALQRSLFDQYQFLNQKSVKKSLSEIFQNSPPPAGAGECAAPKLLQYAFMNQMKPLAIAEFWWGQAPKSKIRKHGHFYPACRGKCEPILAHMLEGIEMDENPMLADPGIGKEIITIYEDDQLLVINKPAEFLSVPGKSILDSVFYRMKQKYREATGPLIVHRLDMSTSGLMLIAKTKEVHKFLQKQFIKRTIKKRYVALLEGILRREEGIIDLPIRVDLDDRPRQLVCFEHGKSAQTKWKVVERFNGQTRIHFFPITGRTHQLRVHAAHKLGLNLPIVGDDLYGNKANRLYLHAEFIEFLHPASREIMTIQCEAEF